MTFQERRVHTNSRGFRDKDYGPKGDKPRIVSLGDSIAFGASVRQEDSYAEVLERLLNEGDGPGAEVINGGVSGYNLLQYILLYAHKAKQYDPDLILMGLFQDDMLPPYIPKEHRFQIVLLQRSILYRTLADRFQSLNPIHGSEQTTLVGRAREQSVKHLRKLKRELEKEGRSLLVIEQPDLQPGDYVDRYRCSHCKELRELDIDYIEMFPVYRKTGKPLVSFSIEPQGDPHPNAMGHRLIAETVRDYLVEHPEMLH
jgi:hypothetical protein